MVYSLYQNMARLPVYNYVDANIYNVSMNTPTLVDPAIRLLEEGVPIEAYTAKPLNRLRRDIWMRPGYGMAQHDQSTKITTYLRSLT